MSGSKLLEKFAERRALSEQSEGHADEDIDDLGAFGFLRGLHERSPMICLRRKDGDIMAVGYSYIDRMSFDPSNVTLFFGLTRNRVPWIAESDQPAALQAARDALVVEAIKW